MRVLLASAEASPFAKVGGLADVVGSLPLALRALGVDARIILPGYGFIDHQAYGIQPLAEFSLPHRLGTTAIQLYICDHAGLPVYFLQAPPYFGLEGQVYSAWDWDMQRFIFFNQALMAALQHLSEQLHWRPDALHVNDWHSSLLPFMLASHGAADQSPATVLSIHNIAYQGQAAGGFLWQAGIHGRHHPDLQELGLTDNLLGIGIAYSDMIATVSPRYAEEIKYPYAGYALAPLIQRRSDDLRGILNGLDCASWDPATDPALAANFNSDNFRSQRPANKRHLQSFARLLVQDGIPLVGIVSRLAAQKGFDMALPALRSLLTSREMQVVVLGTGEPELEQAFWQLEQDFADQARAFLFFNGSLAQQIYAGCDIFLMPSHFEPCGMGQMMAMTYGALPLVRETGGLADTVSNYDDGDAESGTGFVFQWQEAQAVEGTLSWALDTFHNRRSAWQRMQKRAMQSDFSWENSAGQYINLYKRAISRAQT
ncbi:MAG: glycogen synthase [Chloroflexi bacterium]|nr:glycogen synthase [Chloroflexota bacterium]MXV94271.1 glycogen synthase [Chloroflexota bacterium]MXX52291.1 glycogen synthase [Chloroflexota bacterium]MXX84072.1 glycogen synthase [Chloroflexota bacterium]MYA93492.1 glycogen synthase [Chloroflexota bacterium]